MKRYNKYLKLVTGVVLVAFLLPQIAFAKPAPGRDGIDEEYGVIGDIFIDGLKVDVDNSVFNFVFPDGHVMVMLEVFTDFLGYTMTYEESSGKVTVSENGAVKWKLQVDSKMYESDGKQKQLQHPVCTYKEVKKENVYVPLELFIEELHAEAKWSGETRQKCEKRYASRNMNILYVNEIGMMASSQIHLYTANREREEQWGNYNVDDWAKGMCYIIMRANGEDPSKIYLNSGETAPSETVRDGWQFLYSYNAYSREEALDTLNWLALMGHRADFAVAAEVFKSLTKEEYNEVLTNAEGMDKYMIPYTLELDKKWGDRGILCWDMFRLSHVACWAYHAGYITKGEALDYIEVAANAVKANFNSWDEAVDNYLDGYAWWGRTDVSKENSSYHKRYRIYKNAKADATTAKTYFNDALFRQNVVGRAKSVTTCYINDEEMQIGVNEGQIYIDANSRTMVPLRTLAEAMNFTVNWNTVDKSITIENGPKGTVIFYLDSPKYSIDGNAYTMDTTAVSLPPGRTHVPLRYVAESLGADVKAAKTDKGMRIDIKTTAV